MRRRAARWATTGTASSLGSAACLDRVHGSPFEPLAPTGSGFGHGSRFFPEMIEQQVNPRTVTSASGSATLTSHNNDDDKSNYVLCNTSSLHLQPPVPGAIRTKATLYVCLPRMAWLR